MERMKGRRVRIWLLAVILILSLTGCQLAREDGKEEEDGITESDRLIGVLVTREYLDLFDMEGYLNDHMDQVLNGNVQMNEADSSFQGRLYATLEKGPEEGAVSADYIFDVLGGMALYAAEIPQEDGRLYTRSYTGDGISDVSLYLNSSDSDGEKNEIILKGTVYMVPDSISGGLIYVNPVCQSADGQVYAVSGEGVMMNADGEGTAWTVTYEGSLTTVVGGVTREVCSSVELKLETAIPPESAALLQMDADSNVISRQVFVPDELPDVLTLEAETAYVVVELSRIVGTGETDISRSLYDRGAEGLEILCDRGDGICVKRWVELQ